MFPRPACLLLIACLWILCFENMVSGQDNWPRFRGPQANGVVPDDPRLPEIWDQETNVRWKTRIPGWGWGSPIVWGDRVFVSAVHSDDEYEKPKGGLYPVSYTHLTLPTILLV